MKTSVNINFATQIENGFYACVSMLMMYIEIARGNQIVFRYFPIEMN